MKIDIDTEKESPLETKRIAEQRSNDVADKETINRIKEIAIDAYVELRNMRPDMNGHDYAYKAGYAKMALSRILGELGVWEEKNE